MSATASLKSSLQDDTATLLAEIARLERSSATAIAGTPTFERSTRAENSIACHPERTRF